MSQLPDGILPCQWIRDAMASAVVAADEPVAPGQVQPNSLDLRLSPEGCRVQCSFLPGRSGMAIKLSQLRWYDVTLDGDGKVLEPDQVYIFRLMERLALPPGVSARCNPKSSTGRLDVFVRVTTEHGRTFDEVPDGYAGPLYLEVVPRSFAIRVRPGDALAQIRFQRGDAELSDVEIGELLGREVVVVGPKGRPIAPDRVDVAAGLRLSVRAHHKDSGATIGFKARQSTPPIDLRAINAVSVSRYWERIYSRPSEPLILDPDAFYIFRSRELIRLPPGVCAEMMAFDAASGELRTHYAGFFDTGFGYAPGEPPDRTASAVVLEVRNRDVPILLEDGQPLFRVMLLRNAAEPDVLYGAGLRSNYQGQRLRLGKQFKSARTDEPPREQMPLLPGM